VEKMQRDMAEIQKKNMVEEMGERIRKNLKAAGFNPSYSGGDN
jgi:hypothetical protein